MDLDVVIGELNVVMGDPSFEVLFSDRIPLGEATDFFVEEYKSFNPSTQEPIRHEVLDERMAFIEGDLFSCFYVLPIGNLDFGLTSFFSFETNESVFAKKRLQEFRDYLSQKYL